MRVYVISDYRAICSVEIEKETPKCLMILKGSQKDHWRKTYYIGDRVWKEKDRWFKTLPEAVEGLVSMYQKDIERWSIRLHDEQKEYAEFLEAKARFETEARP
jgi:hypothetical protein